MKNLWCVLRVVFSIFIFSLATPAFAEVESGTVGDEDTLTGPAQSPAVETVAEAVTKEPHAKLDCGGFIAQVKTQTEAKLGKKEAAVIAKLAAGKSRPWPEGWRFKIWKRAVWPGVYRALVSFDKFVTGLNAPDFSKHLSSYELAVGSDPKAKKVQLVLTEIARVQT